MTWIYIHNPIISKMFTCSQGFPFPAKGQEKTESLTFLSRVSTAQHSLCPCYLIICVHVGGCAWNQNDGKQ